MHIYTQMYYVLLKNFSLSKYAVVIIGLNCLSLDPCKKQLPCKQ